MKLVLHFDDLEIVSTNDMYIPTVGRVRDNGKRRAFLRSSQELMNFQDKFDLMLESMSDRIVNFANKCKTDYQYLGFKVILLIGMPKDVLFYKRNPDDLRPRDASNYIKAPEDRLANILGIDDKYTMDIRSVKYLSDTNNWKLSIVIESVNYKDYTSNYIKEVFLNENC